MSFIEGKGEQKNRLSLRVPDFSVPGSEYAVLAVLGKIALHSLEKNVRKCS